MTTRRAVEELAQAEALDVTCPTCDEPPMAACTYRFYGDVYVIVGYHDARTDLAERTALCPACGSADTGTTGGNSPDGEYTVDVCEACGWVGDPR